MRCSDSVLVLVLVVTACGDNVPAIRVDIFRDRTATQALLAYREGTGAWRTPSIVSETDQDVFYELLVSDEYELVSVCVAPDGRFDAEELFGTEKDGDTGLACDVATISLPRLPGVQVAGEMEQPGDVYMDSQDGRDQTWSAVGPWSFLLTVPPGARDFIAMGRSSNAPGSGRTVIRRNLDISDATLLPRVDLVSDGVALAPLKLTITGVEGDDVSLHASLFTANGGAYLPINYPTLSVVPQSLTESTDYQQLWIDATPPSPTSSSRFPFRDIFAEVTDTGPSQFQLMQKLDGVRFLVTQNADGELATTWSTIPIQALSTLGISISGCGGSETVSASRSWLDSHGANAILFDTSAPGYQARWRFGLTDGYGACFQIGDNTNTPASTGICEHHPGLSPPELCHLPITSTERMSMTRSLFRRGRSWSSR